ENRGTCGFTGLFTRFAGAEYSTRGNPEAVRFRNDCRGKPNTPAVNQKSTFLIGMNLRKREEMNNSGRFRGASPRVNILLSLALVVLSFASCSGQSPALSMKPADSAPPVASTTGSTGLPGLQTSYADLV